jgi:2-hydroxycyclohexanecarboxyl-CoA dehydrogenase
LEGRRCVVTGAAGGIGQAICHRLAAEGAHVIVTDVEGAGGPEVAAACGGESHVLDVTDHEAAAGLAARVGPVDVLVNNAGWDQGMLFLDSTPDFWEKVVRINLLGHVAVTHAFAKGMAERGGGRIVTVASDAGKVGSTGETVYAAAKGGLLAFTRSLARELARYDVTVNCVCPGPTETPMLGQVFPDERGQKILDAMRRSSPLRRLGKPDDIAACIAYLASDDAAFVTGQAISVDGGLVMGAG